VPNDGSSIRAVLFDFDGTLADSYPAITASVNHVRSLHSLPPLPIDEVRRFVGRGPEYLIGQTVPVGDVNRNTAKYKAHHPSVMKSGTHLFPGVPDLLTALKQRGYPLAICSNKPRAFTVALLDYLRIGTLIDFVIGPEDVPRPKPAPDMLKKALRQLRLDGQAALYVGDMVVDIETARGAGTAVWVVPTGSNDRATLEAGNPDRVLDNLGEMASLLPVCV
jgi:2-phosphoglycolate phosphatase